MTFLWDNDGIPIGFLWGFHDGSMFFFPMILPLDFYGISMEILWAFYGIPEGCL